MNVKRIVSNKFDELRRESTTCGRAKLGANKKFATRIMRSKLKEFDRQLVEAELTDFAESKEVTSCDIIRRVAYCSEKNIYA